MKKVPCFLKLLLLASLALGILTPLAASELPNSIKGFKKETLEVYFNRADQERASANWDRVARFGAEAAISHWEREAVQLYSDPGALNQANAQLAGWVGTQMQERYDKWLKVGAQPSGTLAAVIRRTARAAGKPA